MRSFGNREAPPTLLASALVVSVVAAMGFVPMPTHVPAAGTAGRPGGARAGVILALGETVDVDHEADFFNRRTILTFTYLTGIPLQEICSDVDLDDVVLVVQLPSGVQFVEAIQETRGGSNPLPPTSVSGGTLTWELGTLDRIDNCFGRTRLAVTVEADPSLADDEALQATASISTSTAGDDPADNEASVVFPAVMFSLQVVIHSAQTECYSESTGQQLTSEDGLARSCGQPVAAASARRTDPPGPLGVVSASGEDPLVRLTRQRVRGVALNDYVAYSGVDTRVWIENPNPFEVPLDLHYDVLLHCRTRNGAQAEVADFGTLGNYAECGYGIVEDMSELLRLHYRARGGLNGACETRLSLLSGERDDELIDETEPDCTLQTVGTFLELHVDLRGEVNGAAGGAGIFNGLAWLCIAVSANDCGTPNEATEVIALSPVDLLITDGEGRRVGRVDDPDLGTFDAAEIPGSAYSGAGTEPQTITLGLAEPGEYTLTLLGTGDGPYTIMVTAESDDGTVTEAGSFSGEATAGMTLERGVIMGSDGRVALEPELELDAVVAHLLGIDTTLDDAQLDFLDLLGNENEAFDVGDFRAYLISIGVIQ